MPHRPGDPSLASEEMIPRYLFRESDFGEMDFFEDCQDLDIPHDLMVQWPVCFVRNELSGVAG